MPRRHRAGRDRAQVAPPRTFGGAAPGWAQVPGFRAQAVTNDGTYRCPGCDHEIRAGTPHLVVVPDGDVEGRRHWHTPCWRQEVNRRR